ncbi:hypothetical protein BD770DRAFT_393355 [Pilaira anomala]|nr:hypothetical protein BD770DRAFT_393355 [Pilaira anomala]
MFHRYRLVLPQANSFRAFSIFSRMQAPKQFVVILKDFTDPECLQRRLANREAHLNGAFVNQDKGAIQLGAAILDKPEDGKMIGSCLIVTAESTEELDAMLKEDPYYKGKVWEKWDAYPIKTALGKISR